MSCLQLTMQASTLLSRKVITCRTPEAPTDRRLKIFNGEGYGLCWRLARGGRCRIHCGAIIIGLPLFGKEITKSSLFRIGRSATGPGATVVFAWGA
jgi:hypothetical protein